MRALDRLALVLDAVAAQPGGATVTDIARAADLSVPTVSRLARDLAHTGLLQRLPASSGYVIGSRLLAITRAWSRRGTLLDIALPAMHTLRDESRETVSLHVRVGTQRVCVAEVQSPEDVRRVVTVGLSIPLVVGATGHALLAHLPDLDRASCLADLATQDRAVMEERLEQVRGSGYALATDGYVRGVSGIAAPILVHGEASAVLSVSGPSFRWTATRMDAFASRLLEVARSIGRQAIGGAGADSRAAQPSMASHTGGILE